jgi:hypothetical protein
VSSGDDLLVHKYSVRTIHPCESFAIIFPGAGGIQQQQTSSRFGRPRYPVEDVLERVNPLRRGRLKRLGKWCQDTANNPYREQFVPKRVERFSTFLSC